MISEEFSMSEFPKSLVDDGTKIGKQSKLVHSVTEKNELFLSMENGILTLRVDGTWEWSPR